MPGDDHVNHGGGPSRTFLDSFKFLFQNLSSQGFEMLFDQDPLFYYPFRTADSCADIAYLFQIFH